MRDRYRNWYKEDDDFRGPVKPITAGHYRDLEDLVLQDLGKATTDADRLEILDSYSLASQRRYRNEIYGTIMDIGQRFFVKLLGPTLKVTLPDSRPPYHPEVATSTGSASINAAAKILNPEI